MTCHLVCAPNTKKICIYALDFKIFLFPNKRLTCPNIQKVSTNRSAIKMPELVSFFRRIQSAKNKPLKPEEMITFFKFCFKLFDLSHYKSLLNADTLRADVSKYRPEAYKTQKLKNPKKIHRVALVELLSEIYFLFRFDDYY